MSKLTIYHRIIEDAAEFLVYNRSIKDFAEWVGKDFQAEHFYYKMPELIEDCNGDIKAAARMFLFDYLEDYNLKNYLLYLLDKVDWFGETNGKALRELIESKDF